MVFTGQMFDVSVVQLLGNPLFLCVFEKLEILNKTRTVINFIQSKFGTIWEYGNVSLSGVFWIKMVAVFGCQQTSQKHCPSFRWVAISGRC